MAESVTLARVGKRFEGGAGTLQVLEGVQLHIPHGQFVAILGPSGCGKSTLLRLIAGLDQPSSGTVRLGNQEVREVDPRSAIVFQEPRLFPWQTIAQNVAIGGRRSSTAIDPDELLRLVGLTEFRNVYPHQLSGGMAQRAALARALVGHPEVLLLDEPFASLDALTRMQMQDLLADVCRSVQPTTIMVTHDIDEALYLADAIVIMGQRPATITATINVALPHPRDRGDHHLVALRTEILSHFGFAHAESRNGADDRAPVLRENSYA